MKSWTGGNTVSEFRFATWRVACRGGSGGGIHNINTVDENVIGTHDFDSYGFVGGEDEGLGVGEGGEGVEGGAGELGGEIESAGETDVGGDRYVDQNKVGNCDPFVEVGLGVCDDALDGTHTIADTCRVQALCLDH